jgi:tetratricopeptide (TPR) repeat protein
MSKAFPLLLLAVVLAAVPTARGPRAAGPMAEPSPEEIAALIATLGDADYHKREAAAATLKSLGPSAFDALLVAAEVSEDLEVALRAKWLVDAIPLTAPHDPPEIVKLLGRFSQGGFADHVQAMRRLLRADNDAGIEPLARIVRLDRTMAGSRVAAALLAREWQPDNPFFPDIRGKIAAGLGASERPASRFLKAVVAFSQADAAGPKAAALEAASVAFEALSHGPTDPLPPKDGVDAEAILEETQSIFARCRVQMLLAAGRRDEALAEARKLLEKCLAAEEDPDTLAAEAVEVLVWAVEAGMPEAVDGLAARPEFIEDHAIVGYAAAFAEKARGNVGRADLLATAAFEKTAGDFSDRLQGAILLAKWGCVEWATRAYASVVDNPQAQPAELALASIMYAEYLHDLERDDDAASCLRRLVKLQEENPGNHAQALQQLGRDPRSTRSRMHFFEACAAAARGAAAARRSAVSKAIEAYPKDVDALIAAYTIPDNTPEQRSEFVQKINAALSRIDAEIQAVPDDANGYNEYAWLVANTEGDVAKATRYSKFSLTKSFDNSSYLDTLAHCRAAGGDIKGAIRTQWLAKRQEPHNRTIQRNLERFEKLAR